MVWTKGLSVFVHLVVFLDGLHVLGELSKSEVKLLSGGVGLVVSGEVVHVVFLNVRWSV